jgi:hypothetical protein
VAAAVKQASTALITVAAVAVVVAVLEPLL